MAGLYTGEGATITFTNSADNSDPKTTGGLIATGGIDDRTYCVRSLSLPSFEREKIDVSCLDSAGFKEYISNYLAEIGDVDIVVRWDSMPTNELNQLGWQGTWVYATSTGSPMTLRITFDLLDGQTTAAFVSGSGFIKGVSFSELAGTNVVDMTLSWCFDGRVPPAYTAAT
jgi:hypothetical protein